MGNGLLSGSSEETASAGSSGGANEAWRIWAAIEHIDSHGNLDGFAAPRAERVALISTAIRQRLVSWDSGSYVLTRAGHRSVRAMRRELRRTSAYRHPRRVSRSVGIAVAGAAAAACAAWIVWPPPGSTKLASATGTGISVTPVAPQASQPQQAATAVPAPAAAALAPMSVQTADHPQVPQAAALVEAPAAAATVEQTPAVDAKKRAKHHKHAKKLRANPHEAPTGYGYSPWGGWGGSPSQNRSFGYAGRDFWRIR